MQELLHAHSAAFPLELTVQLDPRHPQVLLVQLGITAWVVPTISSLAQLESFHCQGLLPARNATLPLAVTAQRDPRHPQVLLVPLDITAWVVPTISSLAQSASSPYQGLPHVRNATLLLAVTAPRDHLQQKVLRVPLDISAREELMTKNFAKLLLVTSAPQDQCRQPESPVLSSTIVRAVQMTSNLVVPQQALFVLPGHHRPQA